MKVFRGSRRRVGLAVLSAVVVLGGGVAIATAATTSTPSNAMSHGRGINEYGMTRAFFGGTSLGFTYSKGYYCDTTVKAASSTGCEAGANFKKPPAKDYDPLYITVPLGFTEPMNMLECPASLICVDHPGTIDMSRLESALKPLYPSVSNTALTSALKNFAVPGHDHFITTANWGKPEWWDVKVIGVTSAKTYASIRAHKSFGYINGLLQKKDKNLVGPIPTNLFLYFSVQ